MRSSQARVAVLRQQPRPIAPAFRLNLYVWMDIFQGAADRLGWVNSRGLPVDRAKLSLHRNSYPSESKAIAPASASGSWTSTEPGAARLPVQELSHARKRILENLQAGPRRNETLDRPRQDWSVETDESPLCPAPLQERDFFPLKDFQVLTPDAQMSMDLPDVDMFWDKRVEETELGSGEVSDVLLMTWQERDGNDYELAYKPPLSQDFPLKNQKLVNNVLMRRIDQLLGFDVIVESTLQTPLQDQKGQEGGLFMARARGSLGVEAGKRQPDLQRAPGLCRDLVKLDVVDYLCGASDRHDRNYPVDKGPDGSFKATGIDNDMAFESGTGAPATFDVLDTEMAKAILQVKPGDLVSIGQDQGLDDLQVRDLLTRLQKLKEHVEDLLGTDALIKPTQWEDHLDGLPEMSLARNYGSGSLGEED